MICFDMNSVYKVLVNISTLFKDMSVFRCAFRQTIVSLRPMHELNQESKQ